MLKFASPTEIDELSTNPPTPDLTAEDDQKVRKRTTFDVEAEAESVSPEDKIKKQCQKFEELEDIAETFVKELLDTSVASATNIEKSSHFKSDTDIEDESSESARTFIEFYGSFTAWPTIENFTISIGRERIEEYLSTWYYEEEWLYDIDLYLKQSDEVSDYYFYETKWSLSTKEYPVAQATASIFFTIEVSRVKPRCCFVDVSYHYEGKTYIHLPFKHSFDENWLFQIIEAKLKFFKTLRF